MISGPASMPKRLPVPPFFSPPIAARLLGLPPGPVFTHHVAECPQFFTRSTPRRFARQDIEAHPRRAGRPITACEFLELECAMASERAEWRAVNNKRPDRVRSAMDIIHRLDCSAAFEASV
jgi:hypothetical protein